MRIFRRTSQELTDQEVQDWLYELRINAYVPDSDFAVTAVFKAKISNERNYYFAGVNVENPDHRLSTHAEEGSIAAMVTSLGKYVEIEEIWLMGAPKELKQGTDDPKGNIEASCCGKCRQQIVNFADEEVPVHYISLNGSIKTTTTGKFLPNRFTLLGKRKNIKEIIPPSAEQVKQQLIRSGVELSQKDIFDWLNSLESADFITGISDTLLLKLDNDSYVAGVKVEDPSYVDISAMQNAVAIVIGEFGKREVTEVWSYRKSEGKKKVPDDAVQPLNLSSIQTLAQFSAGRDIIIHLMNAKGENVDIRLSDTGYYIPTFYNPKPILFE
ncbi:MAG: hypothetical protein HRK26_04445 [Rickettsiaceae bacterium H1]|nr:hypothetical protein [Rickettsiaceae bacterium H1]